MNMHRQIRRTPVILAATLVTALSQAGAMAAVPVQGLYANELQRCVAVLGHSLRAGDAGPVRHTVTRVDEVGAWYEFAIHSELLASSGAPRRSADAQCRANRWSEATETTP